MIDRRVLLFLVCGTGAAIGGYVAHLMKPVPTFEECMIDGMRGQQQVMLGAVNKACSRRTNRLENISYYSGLLGFYPDNDKVKVVGQSDIYDVAEGTFRVAFANCEEAKDADFGKPVAARFVSPNHLEIPLSDMQQLMDGSGGMCFRTDRLMGHYK